MWPRKFFLAVASNETDKDSATSMGVVRRSVKEVAVRTRGQPGGAKRSERKCFETLKTFLTFLIVFVNKH